METVFEIQRIHRTRSAYQGKEYKCDDGHTYIGTADNRLRLVPVATETIFTPTATIPDRTTQQAIEAVGGNALQLVRINLSYGMMNGTNKVFNWAQVPLMVYYNGQLLEKGVGYTQAGTITTLTNAPFAGESLMAYGNI